MPFDDEFPAPPARGVYASRVRDFDGAPMMVAVDRRGHRVAEIAIRGVVTPDAAERILAAQLEESDPGLHLVRESAPTERVSTAALIASWGKLAIRRPSGSVPASRASGPLRRS